MEPCLSLRISVCLPVKWEPIIIGSISQGHCENLVSYYHIKHLAMGLAHKMLCKMLVLIMAPESTRV